MQNKEALRQNITYFLYFFLRQNRDPLFQWLPLPKLLKKLQLLQLVKLFPLLIPTFQAGKLNGPWHFIHSNPMATKCKVIINIVLDDVLIGHYLHIVVIVALFFQHVVKLELGGFALLGHLDESVDLVHVRHLFQRFCVGFLNFWLGDYSSAHYIAFLLDFRWRFNLLLTFFPLHLIQQINNLSWIFQGFIHRIFNHFYNKYKNYWSDSSTVSILTCNIYLSSHYPMRAKPTSYLIF